MTISKNIVLVFLAAAVMGCSDEGAAHPSVETSSVVSYPPGCQICAGFLSASERAQNGSNGTSVPTATTASLYSARNEYQGTQIVVAGAVSQNNIIVTPSALSGPGGTISTVNIKVIPVVERLSGFDNLAEILRPDLVSVSALEAESMTFYYSVYTPLNTAPGVYSGSITVSSSAGTIPQPLAISLTVYGATLPTTSESTFKLDNWLASAGADTGPDKVLELNYNTAPKYSTTWWTILGNMAKNLARHRNNFIHLDISALLLNGLGISGTAPGGDCAVDPIWGCKVCNYTFRADASEFTIFDTFVNTFISAGAASLTNPNIATAPLIVKTDPPDARPVGRYVWLPVISGGTRRLEWCAWDAPATAAYFNALLPALKKHLFVKSWLNNVYFNLMDEPTFAESAGSAGGTIYQQIQTAWSSTADGTPVTPVKSLEAHSYYTTNRSSFLSTLVPIIYNDITCPASGDTYPRAGGASCTTNADCCSEQCSSGTCTAAPSPFGGYAPYASFYQDARVSGKELWLYTSKSPTISDYMNRLTSHALVETRLIPWLAWQIDASGYLHWGWNMWFKMNGDTPTAPDDWSFLGDDNGDNWLVHPNKGANGVFDTVRSEAQLYGIQDYELLTQLKLGAGSIPKPVSAKSIAATLIADPSHFSVAGADADRAHKQVLDELISTNDRARSTVRVHGVESGSPRGAMGLDATRRGAINRDLTDG